MKRFITLTLLALGVVLLAACSAPATAPAAATASAAPATETTTTETTTEITTTEAIVVQDSRGEVTLAAPATRVIACSEEVIDFVIALGVQPIAICSSRVTDESSGQPLANGHYLADAGLGTPLYIGTDDAPSLEEVTQLKPDLVLLGTWAESVIPLVEQVAPVFAVDTLAEGYWRDTMLEIGKALGREAEAEQFLADYDATAVSLKEQLAPLAAETPNVLFWYSYAADFDMVLGPDWAGSKVFDLLGFNVLMPEGVEDSGGGAYQVSPEFLTTVDDADIIFVVRTKLADGTIPDYPVDEILASLDGPRVIYEPIDRTRPSSAPYTDLQVMKEVAGLLADGTEVTIELP